MKLINRAADCNIATYLKCKFDNNLQALIIEGEPEPEEILSAWDAIEMEYNDLVGNKPEELILSNMVDELYTRNKAVHWFFVAINEMIRRANSPLVSVHSNLKKFGINLKWNDNIEDYKKQVANAEIREKSNHIKLADLNQELETVQKQSKTSPKYTRKNFYQLIHAVQALGFIVSETETNMYSFGIMCADYFQMVRDQKPN